MLIGSFVPWVGNILYIAGIGPFAKLDPTPLAFAITGSVFFWGLPRLQLFDIMPVAYEAIFKSMDDGVIVLDNSLRITELNPIIELIFNLKRSNTIGQPLKTLLPEQANWLEIQSDISNIQETMVVGEGLARRHYELNLSPIFIKQVQKGYLLIIHDDTERLKAEQSSRETLRLETELTERRKAETEISHLASFPELNPNPIIELDTIGNVKYANPAARLRFSDLMVMGGKHPFLLGLDTIIQDGNTHLITRDVLIDDAWYEQVLSYVPSTQSYRLYSMEITERKQAVEELIVSEDSLKRAQTLGHIGSWTFDIAKQAITWSEETYLLYERDPKIEPPSPEQEANYYSPEQAQLLRSYTESAIKTGESFSSDFEVKLPSGKRAYYHALVQPVKGPEGKIVKLSGIVQDITERKLAEEEKRRLEEKAQVASRLAAVGEMAAGIAHEINNPLTGVLGFSQMLLENKNLPEDIKENLKLIADGSQRVAEIVKRLLTFARQTKPVKAVANLNELIDNTLKLREYVLKTNSIDVVTRFDPELPRSVIDPGQMQQVFLNLIVNAEQAMNKAHGKGTLTITTKKIDDNIHISFQDDGPGITEENLGHLFEPFFTTKEPGEGTGLGLSLSRSIVLEHNGQMSVDSEFGRGATFIIELPIIKALPSAAEIAPLVKAQPAVAKKGRILVVDDEPGVRALLEKVLTQSGHSVDTIADAGKIGDIIDAGIIYDIIITDVRMPGMSGIELYMLILRKMPSMKNRIIFITGDVMGADIRTFLTRNELPFLAKPFDIKLLKEKINIILNGGQSQNDSPDRSGR